MTNSRLIVNSELGSHSMAKYIYNIIIPINATSLSYPHVWIRFEIDIFINYIRIVVLEIGYIKAISIIKGVPVPSCPIGINTN